MHHKIILLNYCFVSTIDITFIFVTFYLMAIQRGVALLYEKLEFKKILFFYFFELGHGLALLPLFFFLKVLASPQFLRYDNEIDMI